MAFGMTQHYIQGYHYVSLRDYLEVVIGNGRCCCFMLCLDFCVWFGSGEAGDVVNTEEFMVIRSFN